MKNFSNVPFAPNNERLALSPFPVNAYTEEESFESRVRSVICAHLLDKDFSVHVLAAMLHMSYSTLNRRLRKEAHISPNQLIKVVRLEIAAALLMKQSRKISEIAYGVGFNNLSYFTRSFQAHFGVSPSQYRQHVLSS